MSEWVSTKDRMPPKEGKTESSEQVLFVWRGTVRTGSWVEGNNWWEESADDERPWIIPADEVTYWLPFPEPPAEEVTL